MVTRVRHDGSSRVYGRGNSDGFTIVEVIISLFVISSIIIIGYQLLRLGNQVSARARITLSANAIAFAKIQEYENRSFENIPNGNAGADYVIEDFSTQTVNDSDGNINSADAKVRVEPVSLSLKKITVTIDYQVFSDVNTIEYASYIQLGGVGR